MSQRRQTKIEDSLDGDGGFSKFLHTIAGFHPEVIRNREIDSFHARKIGWLMLAVGSYATFIWRFFFSQNGANPFTASVLGLLCGAFIVAFDSTIISSLAAGRKNWIGVLTRITLAFVIGKFLADPAIHYLYQDDITFKMSEINEENRDKQKKLIEAPYEDEIINYEDEILKWETEIENKNKVYLDAIEDYKNEMDGTGGSGRIGFKTIAKRKLKIAKDAEDDWKKTKSRNEKKIEENIVKIEAIRNDVEDELSVYSEISNNISELRREKALQRLIDEDETGSLRFRYYLVTLLLIIFELSAIIAKFFLPMRSYESELLKIQNIEIEDSEGDETLKIEDLKKYYKHASESQSELTSSFFEQNKPINEEKLKDLVKDWEHDKTNTFYELWEKFKYRFILGKEKDRQNRS